MRNKTLSHVIVATQGPLRLPWPTIIKWAQADAARAGYA